ncbi:aminopeptidase [Flavobacterium sp.]|uniref:aminopeptidase n=1 Tax=Flavobacterium sp. TaxID=239 RepID=UPI00345B5642
MKSIFKIFFLGLFLSFPIKLLAQHHSKMNVNIDNEKKELTVNQELIFFNQTDDTLSNIVLNDWMNGYSSKNTPLAARFSDEFERGFHLAKEKERGRTSNISIVDENKTSLTWERDTNHPDVIQIELKEKLLPNQKVTFILNYTVKIPSDKFTKYGFGENGKMYLKNCFLIPARYENKAFVKYENLNLDDCANALSDYDIEIKIPQNFDLFSDLNEIPKDTVSEGSYFYRLSGKNRLDFTLFLDNKKDFEIYKNSNLEVVSNLKDSRLNDIQRAIVIDRIVNYVAENMGKYPQSKITVAQADYDRNPFYGLNQLPFFISPFRDEFLYEIKFLKTYVNNYLHNTLQLDPRKDNWIYDGIQVYIMMKYIEEYHPDSKMMGSVAKLKLLKGYNLVSLNFNGQYSYLYMLMARKNLDQPLANPKNTLIKFNEKIALKYKAGLSFRYLDSYLENDVVSNSIKQFLVLNTAQQTNRKDFENILTTNSPKKIEWFFNKIIDSRDIIDFKFDKVTRTKDSVSFSFKNKTKTNVPISVYGVKDKKIVYKKWFDNITSDSIYTIPRNEAGKIVINYNNEVPEFNRRNNWYSLRSLHFNRPIKFNFLKDLEDPSYNQILYVPTLEYNLYDGLLPGFRFHNKTILDKPFIFDVNPTISTKTSSFSGKGFVYVSQFNRDSNLYHIRYMLSGHYLHYAPDAYYKKLTPIVFLNFRPDDFRDNRKQTIIVKEIIVDKQKTAFTASESSENYQIFNAKYFNTKTEVTNHFSFLGDFQYSNVFGKLATEIQYRKLFDNNRSLNLRLFAGTFLHNKTTSSYFDFGLDRPSDYLFESDYLGRSETTGLFSQQSIVTDGFFKSKLETRTANRWMATINASYSIWSWIEGYGDIGFIKNKDINPKFVYDSGIRLNLVTDYFELFFPVYSNNGWEIGDKNYREKIRFIMTFKPETLINLFTRKWF